MTGCSDWLETSDPSRSSGTSLSSSLHTCCRFDVVMLEVDELLLWSDGGVTISRPLSLRMGILSSSLGEHSSKYFFAESGCFPPWPMRSISRFMFSDLSVCACLSWSKSRSTGEFGIAFVIPWSAVCAVFRSSRGVAS